MADQATNHWRALYVAAYMERDPGKVMGRIEEAEQAMTQWQKEMGSNLRSRNVEAERRTLAPTKRFLSWPSQQIVAQISS
ncbi:MAG: hypothetical protein DMG70_10165 [Acidobacteria bacterium]|nr:MAG: hypothetical protein DMG70_10165 [Acidobacteriota bacterium]